MNQPDGNITSAQADRPIRLVIQQPALPKYRVPVFRELARRPGIDLTLYFGDVPGLSNVEPDGFRAIHVPIKRRRIGTRLSMWHAPQWENATRDLADVLCLSWDLHYGTLVPSLLRAKMNGVPTILWGHGYSKHESLWRRYLRNKVGSLATALLFYNHTAARAAIAGGVDPLRVFVALNSLDQTPIPAARQSWLARPDDLANFQTTNGLTPGRVLLFVSRLEADNRVDLLLTATAVLAKQFPDLRTVIIGRGPDEARLREMVLQLGIADHVIMPGPIYDEDKIAPWFLSASIFCYPANIGLSLLHAFGYGLPAVTSDKTESQNPEIEALRPGENGEVYRDGDANDLARVLSNLLAERTRLSRMSKMATEVVRDVHSLMRMVDGYETAIRYCVGSADARRAAN